MADQDTPMQDPAAAAADTSEPPAPLRFTPGEARVLELYDRLQQLRLEVALLNAQHAYQPDPSAGDVTDQDISAAQHALLESRSAYMLRNDVVESVMTAKPILQAVHYATDATPLERDLLPHIASRDEASLATAAQSTALRSTLDQLTDVEAATVVAARRNADLAAELLRLVREDDRRSGRGHFRPGTGGHGHSSGADDSGNGGGGGAGAGGGSGAVDETTAQLERKLKASRQRWKLVKGVASGVIVGSGVDWARDDNLRELVLDPE